MDKTIFPIREQQIIMQNKQPEAEFLMKNKKYATQSYFRFSYNKREFPFLMDASVHF